MFVVAGVSGNTGKVVAETLLAQKKAVRVLVRDAAKGDAWKAKGAEIAIAELDDVDAVTKALTGAEGAYLLLPPQWASTNVRGDNAKRAGGLAKAVEKSGVKHVVFLSSIASDQKEGTGPITSTYEAEKIFGELKATSVTFVRAAYFMENIGASLYALGQGQFPTFIRADLSMPMVASHDIGTTAAKALLEGGKGHSVIELSGPREYTQNDVAAALSNLTKKTIRVQQGPEEAMEGALIGAGLSPTWAKLYAEMTHGINVGHVKFEGRGARAVRGTTALETVLEKLIAAGSTGA